MKIRHKKWLYAAVFLTSALLLAGCEGKEERAVKEAVSAELDQLKSPDKKTIENISPSMSFSLTQTTGRKIWTLTLSKSFHGILKISLTP